MWAFFLLVGCGSSTPTSPGDPSAAAPQAKKVNVTQLAAALAGGSVPVLVDVRSPEEFARQRVPAAINLPLSELEARIDELEPYAQGDIYVICQSGGRSARAIGVMETHGLHAINVVGGTGAWAAAGSPTAP